MRARDEMATSVHDDPCPVEPRLLDLRQAAKYLSLSYWTLRDYVLAGRIRTVQLPALMPRDGARPGQSLRRILIDRADLDRFVDELKGGGGHMLARPPTKHTGRR